MTVDQPKDRLFPCFSAMCENLFSPFFTCFLVSSCYLVISYAPQVSNLFLTFFFFLSFPLSYSPGFVSQKPGYLWSVVHMQLVFCYPCHLTFNKPPLHSIMKYFLLIRQLNKSSSHVESILLFGVMSTACTSLVHMYDLLADPTSFYLLSFSVSLVLGARIPFR